MSENIYIQTFGGKLPIKHNHYMNVYWQSRPCNTDQNTKLQLQLYISNSGTAP
jgi:hypothetical protein